MVGSRDMSGREGLVLVTTFLMILLLATMASGIISMLMEEGMLTANRIELARTESIADAAESYAMSKMNELSGWESWSGVTDNSFAGGKFSVEVVNLSSDEKKLQCTGKFGRSAAVRERFVRRGPLAAEDTASLYISDNALLVSAADFVLVTTRFDNPSRNEQGGGDGDWVYIRVSVGGVRLQPDGTNIIRLERLDGSTEVRDAFVYDVANGWLEAAFRLPQANNGEWTDCLVNVGIETEIAALDYVPDSRKKKNNNDVLCHIENNTGETVVLTAMTAGWDQPQAYYEQIKVKVLKGGTNYRDVWDYDGERAGRGEKAVFNQGKTVTIGAGETFELQILNFRSTRTGPGSNVDMDSTPFRITFFVGDGETEVQYPKAIVPVAAGAAVTPTFQVSQAIRVGMPQPTVRVYESSAARTEEGEGLRRWRLSQGQTYYLRAWTDRLSGPLKSGEGKLKLLDLFGHEENSDANAFSEVGQGRYDADIRIPVEGEDLPADWEDVPVKGWDYVLRIEMEDLAGERVRYSSAVQVVE